MQEDENAAYRAEAAGLLPKVEGLHRSARRLKLFNSVSLLIPTVSVVVPMVVSGAFFQPTHVLLGGLAAAVATQISRWRVSSLRGRFKAIWDEAGKDTREITLGMIGDALDNRIGKSTLVVSKDDFSLRHPHTVVPLVATAATAYLYPPLAPLAFFAGSQTREYGNSAVLESAARHNLLFLDAINRGPMRNSPGPV